MRLGGTLFRHVRTESFVIWTTALASLVAYALIFLPFLPEADNTGGPDYSYFLPQLLAGYYWFLHNGPLSVPWFTPAFCAGIPYYGNMQGMYFSLPQFLTFAVGPTMALRATFLTFAAIGLGGFYALSRRAFGMSRWMALAGGVLFLFNGFYAARFIIAHITFHAFMLVPLLGVCVLAGAKPETRRVSFDGWLLLGALVLAYMVQSGMVHALPPSLLGIVAIILVHGYLYGLQIGPFIRLLVMGCVALAMSAAKLAAGMAFLSQFPRDMIPLSGFDSLWQSLTVTLQSLFIAPAFGKGAMWLQNNQWFPDTKVVLAYHEFEYGVTFLPPLILLMWFAAHLVSRFRRKPRAGIGSSRAIILLVVALLLAIPVLLNWYEPTWTATLKRLPLFGNSSTLIRWICLYIPLIVLVSMLVVDRARVLERVRPTAALVIVAFVVIHNAGIDRQYYTTRGNYDFATVERAYVSARNGAPVPPVSRVEHPGLDFSQFMSRRDRNESLVRGATNAQCYEPMFGHRLEEYPYGALREGPALQSENGILNLKNPACMLYPDANGCQPGDHFASAELSAARDFTEYRPFPFRFPWWQTLANWISLLSLLLVLSGLAFLGARRVRGPRPRHAQEA